MKTIFNQIHRFSDVEFSEGESFNIVLQSINKPSRVSREEVEVNNEVVEVSSTQMCVGGTYRIHVKGYMTEPSSPSFDFQSNWNNNIPMPLCIMEGEVISETRGMYRMKLHGTARPTSTCICCGRRLTNKISMLYGIGPECGSHFYINPYSSKEELQEAWEELKAKVANIQWEGFVIKSAIKEWEVI